MTQPTLKQSVMEQVESGTLTQRARTFFVLKEYGLWALAVLSIIIGAFAMALIFAAIDDLRATMFLLRSYDMQGIFLLLPYLWILTVILCVVLGYYRIRHTGQGYRYTVWLVVTIVSFGSVFGGAIIYATGIAHSTDRFLASHIDTYKRFGNPQHGVWESPESGMLAGKVINIATSSIAIRDIRGNEWGITGNGVTTTMKEGAFVRIIGTVEDEFLFEANSLVVMPPPRSRHMFPRPKMHTVPK